MNAIVKTLVITAVQLTLKYGPDVLTEIKNKEEWQLAVDALKGLEKLLPLLQDL